MKREDEIAATNKLLQVIRGEGEPLECESEPLEDEKFELDLGSKDSLYRVEEFSIESPLTEGDNAPTQLTKSYSAFEEKETFQKPGESGGKNPLPITAKVEGNSKKKPGSIIKQEGELKTDIKSYVGLDIGSKYIKFVQIQHKLSKKHLVCWGVIEIITESEENRLAAKVEILKGLLQGISQSRTKVISSIGGPSVIVRHIKFPPLSNKEIEESIKWEAKSYIPFPLREVAIDYQILARSPKSKQVDVLLVAVTKKILKEHVEALQNIQINPHIVDINSLALVNSFMTDNGFKEDRAIVMLDIGASTTILNIYKKNGFYFTRDIPIAGDALNAHLKNEQRFSYEEAENHKKDKNFNLELVKPVLDNLIKEIRRSLIYYDNQTSRSGFSRVILSGGSCRLTGLEQYLTEELGLSVEIANPLRSIYIDPKKFSGLENFSPQLALAFGLTNR